MKNTVFAKSLTLFVIILSLVGCLGGGTNTGIPPYGTNLAFEDKSKGSMLLDSKIRFERVDLTDSTRVIDSRLGRAAIAYYGSEKYACLFRIQGGLTTDTLVVRGWNKFRIVYTGKKEMDWLEFYTRSTEGPLPEQVRFNGKEIPRLTVDEPVSPSYLYVLK